MINCSVQKCDCIAVKKGFCQKHYLRNYRHGSPEPKGLIEKFVGLSLKERFMKYVFPMPSDIGCWMWTGSLSNTGYGQININGKCTLATRISLLLFKNGINENLCALHTCDTPQCVNPDHLFIGTKQDNSTDMMLKKRYPLGSKHKSSKLKESDIYEILQSTESQRKLAKKYGVTQPTISVIKSKKTWSHLYA